MSLTIDELVTMMNQNEQLLTNDELAILQLARNEHPKGIHVSTVAGGEDAFERLLARGAIEAIRDNEGSSSPAFRRRQLAVRWWRITDAGRKLLEEHTAVGEKESA